MPLMHKYTVRGNGARSALYGAGPLNAQGHQDETHCMLPCIPCIMATRRCSWRSHGLHAVNTLGWLKTLFTLLPHLLVSPHFKSPESMTQEPRAPALGSPKRGTFSTQPCFAPFCLQLPNRQQGCFQLTWLTEPPIPRAGPGCPFSPLTTPPHPWNSPSFWCSRLSPSAHSSRLQNGTNPMRSNAFLVSVFSFKGQKGKGTWCYIYEPVKLAALTRKCSQVSFLATEGTEQVPGKGSCVRGGWAVICDVSSHL